jgi:hypothetical protein
MFLKSVEGSLSMLSNIGERYFFNLVKYDKLIKYDSYLCFACVC